MDEQGMALGTHEIEQKYGAISEQDLREDSDVQLLAAIRKTQDLLRAWRENAPNLEEPNTYTRPNGNETTIHSQNPNHVHVKEIFDNARWTEYNFKADSGELMVLDYDPDGQLLSTTQDDRPDRPQDKFPDWDVYEALSEILADCDNLQSVH